MSLFSLKQGRAHARLIQVGALALAGALAVGCGAGYRPVVTPINPSGPASQPQSFAVVVSAPSTTTPGIATVIDYAGDTVLASAPIGPGPTMFTLDETGADGYTLNSDGTLTNFQVGITEPQAKDVQYTTLPIVSNAWTQPTSPIVSLFTPSAGLWATSLDGNVVDALTGFPATFKLSIPVESIPITLVGSGTISERNYAIMQNISDPTGIACNVSPRTVGASGIADAIETANYSISARIPLGKCPVFAVESPDTRRVFVLNRGDDTITVINSQNNALDACTPFTNQNGQLVTCHPSLPLSTSAGLTGANVPAIAGPVYAQYNAATSQLVVANYDGGTISVIDVSLDQYGNDSATFGTTFTIPVGNTTHANPASVTVLYDGSRAYTANQNDDTTSGGTGTGTVTVVNLVSHTVIKTLPVNGHPRTVSSIQNSLFGKVYVASPDSPYLTIIRTDQDIVDTNILVQGNVVDVRTSTQNGTSGNTNIVSRVPGHGQPCNLSTGQLNPGQTTLPAGLTLTRCLSQTP